MIVAVTFGVVLAVLGALVGARGVALTRAREETQREVDGLREASRRRDEVDKVLHSLLGELPLAFVAVDQDARIIMSIGRESHVQETTDEETAGMHIAEVLPGQPWIDIVDKALAGKTVHRLVDHTPGNIYEVSAAPIVTDGNVTGMTAVLSEVSERIELEEELRVQAETDELTGLVNRSMFQRELDAAIRYEHASAYLLMMDVDGFKHINDTYGHACGDEVLKALARRLHEAIRLDDLVARLGGDEFGLLIRADSADHVDVLAEALCTKVAGPIEFGNGVAHLTASIGAVGPDVDTPEAHSGEAALANADLAMYEAKRRGGDRTVWFSRDMRDGYVEREQLKSELSPALARDEFVVHYQPIWDARTGLPLAIEALVRWQHPVRGLLRPAEFIDLAAERGLMSNVDFAVFRKACAQLSAWDELIDHPGMRAMSLSSNFSPNDFARPPCLVLAEEMTDTFDFDPGRLVVEVTEAALLANVDRADRAVERLRALGIRIALDDFGTGYSSLAQLHELRPDVLKIDKMFVQQAEDSASVTVKTVVAFAEALGMTTVAEGVETAEQLALVQGAGCRGVQGNLLGAAMPADELTDLLRLTLDAGHPLIADSPIVLDATGATTGTPTLGTTPTPHN